MVYLDHNPEREPMRTPFDVPMFNSPRECVRWCVKVVRQRIEVSEPAKAWALAQLEAYRSGNWLGTNEKPKPRLRASVSRYDYALNNSPEITQLTQTLRRGSRSSGRKITLPKISKGKSDE